MIRALCIPLLQVLQVQDSRASMRHTNNWVRAHCCLSAQHLRTHNFSTRLPYCTNPWVHSTLSTSMRCPSTPLLQCIASRPLWWAARVMAIWDDCSLWWWNRIKSLWSWWWGVLIVYMSDCHSVRASKIILLHVFTSVLIICASGCHSKRF
jgi:hypothetical protein